MADEATDFTAAGHFPQGDAFGGADVGRACHAHPTLAEAAKEAALAVAERAIHV